MENQSVGATQPAGLLEVRKSSTDGFYMLYDMIVVIILFNIYMAMGQKPGTPVNIPKAFKIDYLGRVIIHKKVP